MDTQSTRVSNQARLKATKTGVGRDYETGAGTRPTNKRENKSHEYQASLRLTMVHQGLTVLLLVTSVLYIALKTFQACLGRF